MKRSKGLWAAAALAGSLFAGSAGAVMITAGSGNLDVTYNGYGDGGAIAGLKAEATFSGWTFSGNTLRFDFTLKNTSVSPVDGSRISGLGFVTAPDVTGGSATGVFPNLIADGKYPNQIGDISFCVQDGGNACQGGGNGGITLGNTGSGTITITFANTVTAVDFKDFYIRYQSVSCIDGYTGACPGSASGDGTVTERPPGNLVPEPATLALLSLGLLGAGLMRRRRQH